MKKPTPTISCVIPAYNEGPRIEKVLSLALSYRKFSEVVVVNDGSSDNTQKILSAYKKTHPQLSIFRHNRNKGKTAAIINGIKKASGQIIVLLDADLEDILLKNLDQLINPIIQDGYDMTILDRISDRKSIIGWTNIPRLLGGERAFYKEEFEKIIIDPQKGYLLEVIMNTHYVKNKLKVKTIYCRDLKSSYQFKKWGFFKALFRYADMFIKIYKESRIKGFYMQIINIEEDRIGKVYELTKKLPFSQVTKAIIIPIGLGRAILTTIRTNLPLLKDLYKIAPGLEKADIIKE
ncbi:glycosyltransferase family 2 protein [Candidatus Dojkabacteria bacterium]|nr:glycosyltransferase family 2 protein [Candidatus Dojkabacteria bacterium]